MHIAYVLSPGGGPEAYVREMLPWLREKGCKISILNITDTLSSFGTDIQVSNVRYGKLHYYLYRLIGHLGHLSVVLKSFEIESAIIKALKGIEKECPVDLVEVVEGTRIDSLKKRWKVLVRAHGSDWMFRHYCTDGDQRHDAFLMKKEKRQLFLANAVSAISEDLSANLTQLCGIPSKPIHTIPYPINERIFYPNATKRDEPFSLMSVGRLEKRKGTDILLRAMNQVWQVFPGTRVYILGSEADLKKQDLLSGVREENRDKVIFPGFVGRDKLPDYYRRISLYVAPTQYETFGYTILEAMASGVPVIASRTGAIPELVEDGVNGVLLPYGSVESLAEKIILLLSDEEKRKKMGIEGREKAMKYGLDVVGKQMFDLYRKIVDSNV